jgi:branched-chain amino acid transport system substrate-binding protein
VIQAWADSVNAGGGINSAPVKVFPLDDGTNPATSLKDAKQLVEQDHVIAIVGMTSLGDASWADYVKAHGIPVVGGISPEASFATNPDYFPSGTQLIVQTVGTIALAKTAGKHDIGVLYCAELPICASLPPLAKGAASLYGLKTSIGKVSATAPSYAAPCLSLKSAGVDAVFTATTAPVVERVADGCAQQGFKPLNVAQTSSASLDWLKDPNLDGALLSAYNANPYDTSTQGVAAMQTALKKYAPTALQGVNFTYEVIAPWVGGKLFEAAARAGHITASSTAADLKKGLYALKDETLGGLSGPLNFAPGKPAFIPCYFTEELKGGKFVSLNSDKPTCLTAQQSAALLKVIGG